MALLTMQRESECSELPTSPPAKDKFMKEGSDTGRLRKKKSKELQPGQQSLNSKIHLFTHSKNIY